MTLRLQTPGPLRLSPLDRASDNLPNSLPLNPAFTPLPPQATPPQSVQAPHGHCVHHPTLQHIDGLIDKQANPDQPDESWYLVQWLHPSTTFANKEWVFEGELENFSLDSAKALLEKYLALPASQRTVDFMKWRRNSGDWLMIGANDDNTCLVAALHQACDLLDLAFSFTAEDLQDYKDAQGLFRLREFPTADADGDEAAEALELDGALMFGP
ncbi:hypothetical protein H310_15252 [Aphanomyces invadans]|uniref:Uncharacterized protein n=1 Tax=Aphanomyces invadans TaxID=157072 RepID=A0A024T7R9_9STRA|nr:hypothetical protein H310_15252 [Aphanomyces invadans]ETV89908.1 hypothetical protein H310_15252 [Aphanomyces invadans]|eukprot:XP_008881461.1 hypothetical protein H310_15252 [Aphanomyces invadans]